MMLIMSGSPTPLGAAIPNSERGPDRSSSHETSAFGAPPKQGPPLRDTPRSICGFLGFGLFRAAGFRGPGDLLRASYCSSKWGAMAPRRRPGRRTGALYDNSVLWYSM